MSIGIRMNQFKDMKVELIRFMMSYKFALEEMMTKINILKQEFKYIHDYNPIEHVSSRLKSPESILNKIQRKGYDYSFESITENIRDIAGIRITCAYISDIYKISEMLQKQKDVTLIECKDYIKNPKPNGYQSLHLIVQIPIFMSDREEHINVEIQIRTIAMDFWASLEHKIYYKYNKEIPQHMKDELKEAAVTAAQLDKKMEKLQREMNKLKESTKTEELYTLDDKILLPYDFLSFDK
ncbi:GTP pyrophosphokinase [Fredinandcohnia onubensis]|uniref:GTP pyrophosphokinase n=1 Tax=Fredinandcohnia onubensis TaxID=1571209 RepID=UPI000C0BBAF7|nr:GTP pyrophosphokinase family protein [Fredinandcohnia onubensis]